MIELGDGWGSYLELFKLRSSYNVLCGDLQKEFNLGTTITFDGGVSNSSYDNGYGVFKSINAGSSVLDLTIVGISGIDGLDEDLDAGNSTTYVTDAVGYISLLECLAYAFGKYKFKVDPYCYVSSKDTGIVSKVNEIDFEYQTLSIPYEENAFSDQYLKNSGKEVIDGITAPIGNLYKITGSYKSPLVASKVTRNLVHIEFSCRPANSSSYLTSAGLLNSEVIPTDLGPIESTLSWHRYCIDTLVKSNSTFSVLCKGSIYIADVVVVSYDEVYKPYHDYPDMLKVSCLDYVTGLRPYYAFPIAVSNQYAASLKLFYENCTNKALSITKITFCVLSKPYVSNINGLNYCYVKCSYIGNLFVSKTTVTVVSSSKRNIVSNVTITILNGLCLVFGSTSNVNSFCNLALETSKVIISNVSTIDI